MSIVDDEEIVELLESSFVPFVGKVQIRGAEIYFRVMNGADAIFLMMGYPLAKLCDCAGLESQILKIRRELETAGYQLNAWP